MSRTRIFNLVYKSGTSVDKYIGDKLYISTGSLDNNVQQYVSYDNRPSRANVEVQLNDILITKMKNTNKTTIITLNMINNIYSTGFMVLKAKENICSKYLYYLLQSPEFVSQKDLYSYGTTQKAINDDRFKFISVNYVNNMIKQEKIANYLDKKCELIDKTIEGNKKEIELLENYLDRKTEEIILNATNDCDFIKLKLLGYTQNGISAGADKFIDGVNTFINYGDVYNNDIIPKEPIGSVNLTEEEKKRFSLKKGDILFTRTSETIEEVGMTAVCAYDYPSSAYSGFLIRFRPYKSNMNEQFYKYYFKQTKVRNYFIKEMNIVTRASLSQPLLGNLKVALPSIKIQNQTAELLDNINKKVKSIINYRKQIIEKLEEYKKSLIYEVVTGKKEV